jgi:NADH-quinone oxidoreductase subunit C
MPASPDTIAALKERFPEIAESEFRGDTRVVAVRESLFDVLGFLKEMRGFDLLVDVTCVDYLNYRDARERFGLVYLLASAVSNERITVRCFLDESELSVPSATPLWNGADWMEREVWDMFGVRFEGHPNLMRILLPEEFTAFPLRKDYPLQGRGERHNFPVLRRNEA